VRLAFAIATSVQPDILVIDEALSVGDGAFARKSFDRIMQLKQSGVTLLFCSHSLFQVESLCSRCIWLHQGQVMAQGPSAEVIAKYNDWLSQQAVAKAPFNRIDHATAADTTAATTQDAAADASADTKLNPDLPSFKGSAGSVRFTNLKAHCDDLGGTALTARSGQSLLSVDFEFMADPQLPIPNLALVVYSADGKIVCSTGTWIDGISLTRGADGIGRASLNFPKLPLLKGQYSLTAFLMCERAVHVYEAVEHFATVQVSQPH